MMNFSAAFDASSIAAMGRLAGADIRLDAELIVALDLVAHDVLDAIPANMNFMNPTGRLEGSFFVSGSGMERTVESDVAYAHRREFSFHGPDSLGRSFPNDPAAYYMRAAIDQAGGNVEGRLFTAADNALHP